MLHEYYKVLHENEWFSLNSPKWITCCSLIEYDEEVNCENVGYIHPYPFLD